MTYRASNGAFDPFGLWAASHFSQIRGELGMKFSFWGVSRFTFWRISRNLKDSHANTLGNLFRGRHGMLCCGGKA